jgi:ADP-heptose:LPS heptosyltransferase
MIFNAGVRKKKQIIRDANNARDAREYRRAALLYEKALRLSPNDAAIHIQCGHMFKEAGDLASAEPHYLWAKKLTPSDPDLALQLGHFHKVAGRLKEAERSYRRAMELDPAWPEPAIQLAILYRLYRWRNHTKAIEKGLVPEISPLPPESQLQYYAEEVTVRSLGRRERTRWGMHNTLRGVDAIRGFCISATPIVELRGTLNGVRFYSGTVQEGLPLKYEIYNKNKRKYVFNVWHDFSRLTEGLYNLQLEFVDENGELRVRREEIVVGTPLPEADFPDSDSIISLRETDCRSVDDQINSRPSVVRSPKSALFAEPPRNVLILRTDQLGDMVASIPAMRRLRELLPTAHFVGLLTSSNSDLAATLNLFDEIIVVDFPDDKVERRRIMPLSAQEELRKRLEPYRFDLALDLADSGVSRPLLLLSGARFLYGFYDREWPWLSAGFEGNSHDPKNYAEIVPHSTKVLAMVERLGAMLNSKAQVVRRADLTRERLAAYGISDSDRFAVLHTGGRGLSRWPRYCALASRILEETDLKVILLADDTESREQLTKDLHSSERFRLLEGTLRFDDLDALLSFCTVFVGNDSGPKHLAALRGSKVISIHSGRTNWLEWGQEIDGLIISRKVPCVGCLLYLDDAGECGKDLACVTNISIDEVLGAVTKILQPSLDHD